MGNFVIALLMAIGVGGWVYSKAMKSTGSQTSKALIAAAAVAGVVLVVVWTSLIMFLPE